MGTDSMTPTDSAEKVVADLREEAQRLSGRSIDRGCVDSGIAANLAERAADLIERVERERDEAWGQAHLGHSRAEAAEARVTALEAEKAGLVKAVTPSPETKAAYIGEFHFNWTVWDPTGEEQITHRVQVPWATIKQIMSAIRAQGGER